MIREARSRNVLVHIISVMDPSHPRHSGLTAFFFFFKNTKEVVLHGDVVKDDFGFQTVFTEQGASVSEMAAVGFLDPISRRWGGWKFPLTPNCGWKMLPRHLKLPETDCPKMCIRLPRSRRPEKERDIIPSSSLLRNTLSHLGSGTV